MRRFLGIDYGIRRVGLAIGDDLIRIASPVATVPTRGDVPDHVTSVLEAATTFDVDAFVIGLPMNMDGSEGEQAKRTRRFAEELARRTGKAVHFQDERLSTFAAQELMQPAELSRRKRNAVEDAVAAQVILQTFLDDPEHRRCDVFRGRRGEGSPDDP